MKKLPCEECRGKCCTNPTFTRKEFDDVKAKHGLPIFATVNDFGAGVTLEGVCPYLSGGRCSIHPDRPRNCRAYGEVPQLPCMYLFPVAAATQVHWGLAEMKRQMDP